MNRKLIESKFIDLVEGKLDEDEAKKFFAEIEKDSQLKKRYEDYKKIVAMEEEIKKEKYEVNENFVVKVMDRIEDQSASTFWSKIMKLAVPKRLVVGGLGTLMIAVIAIKFSLIPGATERKLVKPEALTSVASKTSKDQQSNAAVGEPTIAREVNEEESRSFDLEQKIGPGGRQEVDKLRDDFDSAKDSRQRSVVSGKKAKKEAFNLSGIVADRIAPTKKPEAKYDLPADSLEAGEVEIPVAKRGIIAPVDFNYTLKNNERYGDFAENKRFATLDEALSTFSIDVDTGSYTNMRRFIRMGQLPPKSSVRIEEFINYFKYNYPLQYEDDFSVNYEIAPSPLEKEKYLLKVGIKAKDARVSEKPWNLVFLVDVSGSMSSDDKLGLVKSSLKVLLGNMREGDKVSIVTYSGNAGTLLEGATIKDRDQIAARIENLTSGGSTHGSAGIHEAYRIAKKEFIKDGVNRVILATDGDFNVGTTGKDELIKLIEEKRKSGITLTSLGFGTGNYNEAMMEQVANKGNGNYFYIDSFKEARKVFETDLFGTLEVVAKDVKLQIEFNPEHVSHYRLVGYDNRKLNKEDFHNDAIDAGEIGSSHTVTALYEIVFTGSELAKNLDSEYRYQKSRKKIEKTHSKELAFLKIRHKKPNANKSTMKQFPIEVVKVKRDLASASIDFKFAAAVTYFGTLLRDSQFKGDYTFSDIVKLAETALGEDQNGYRKEFVELVKNASVIK